MASPTNTPTLLLLNLPPKAFVGIDLVSFTSSPTFHGITDLPAGFHFLYTGTDASLAIRHGRWLNITKSTIHVLTWNSDDESLVILDPQTDKSRAAVRSIPELRGRGLVNYSALEDANETAQRQHPDFSSPSTFSDPSDWSSLTSHVSSSLLRRILSETWTLSSVSSAPSDAESIPGLTDLEASSALRDETLNVLPVDLKRTWPESAIGRDRTDMARDRSWYLGHMIDTICEIQDGDNRDKKFGASEVLGELQFCFLMVLTLANYSCLEQWKRILEVLWTCRHALLEVEGFFVEAIKVLLLQLRHVEDVDGGLFELKDEWSSMWLRRLLAKMRRNVDDILGDRSMLGDELEGLEGFMRERYGWENGKDVLRRGMLELEDGERVEVSLDGVDEDEETGEYAPVVVEE